MYNFFAFLNRMKYIKRWSLMRSVVNENIMEHSQQVTTIAHALAVIGNTYYNKNYDANKIGMIANFHESSEVITGDLPTPIKYFNPEIMSAYKDLEKNATNRLLDMLPTELKPTYQVLVDGATAEEHAIMKYADKISAYIKCIEEIKAGNGEFTKAHQTIGDELKQCDSLEVQYFIKHFLHGFELTLDELDK